MAVDYYQRLCRDIASSKEIIGRLEAMLPAFYEKAVAEEKAQEEAQAG